MIHFKKEQSGRVFSSLSEGEWLKQLAPPGGRYLYLYTEFLHPKWRIQSAIVKKMGSHISQTSNPVQHISTALHKAEV